MKPNFRIIRYDLSGKSPGTNPNGGFTFGYICDSDPASAACKATALFDWSDTSFLVHDHPMRLRDRPSLSHLRNCAREGDIILIPTYADISRYRSSVKDFRQHFESKNVTITVLEGLQL